MASFCNAAPERLLTGSFIFILLVSSLLDDVVSQDAGVSPPAAGETPTWCIAQRKASLAQLQYALDWVCGPGQADCSAVMPGGSCFLPDNSRGHASYAFNNYYLKNNKAYGSCNFSFLATVTIHNPSYGSCIYPSHL